MVAAPHPLRSELPHLVEVAPIRFRAPSVVQAYHAPIAYLDWVMPAFQALIIATRQAAMGQLLPVVRSRSRSSHCAMLVKEDRLPKKASMGLSERWTANELPALLEIRAGIR